MAQSNPQQSETPARIGIQPYSIGLCFASACAPREASPAEVEDRVNELHPTGLDHGWKISRETHFAGGQTNPCTCNDDPSRMHWLLDC